MDATIVPTAAGRRRRVEMARSKEAHVTITPSATMGSGRMPLLYGSQKARNMNAAVQCAKRLSLTQPPKRGSISRERMNQMISAEIREGRRTIMEALESWESHATRS